MPTPADQPAPAALAAFVRGVERRARALAELQAGDARRGDAAASRALARFLPGAVRQPMAEWPRLFWSALLGQPELARPARAHDDLLAAHPPGRRAALLLRLVAGLDEAEAAAVLDVAPATLRRALQQAMPRRQDGGADAAAWRQLEAGLQRHVRELPEARLRGITGAAVAEDGRPGLRRPVRLWIALGAAATLSLALAATWWWPVGSATGTSRLGPPGAPASTYDRIGGLVSHPDFEAIASPGEAALASEVGFLSWVAAGAPGPASGPGDDGAPPAMTGPVAAPADDLPESDDAP